MLLQTERLQLREMEQSDFLDLAEMLRDPEVMYAYEHDFSAAEVQSWLDRQINRYRTDGFGLWAIVSRQTGQMMGQAGLTWQPVMDSRVLEVGYLLKKKFWHQGYAREAAGACLAYAFEKLNRDRVYAMIKADNEASKRVARSLGMRKEKTFWTHYYSGEKLHELFCIDREQKITRI